MVHSLRRRAAITTLVTALLLAGALGTATAAPATATKSTPPAIAGGVWPALTLTGNFAPRSIKHPVVLVHWIVDTKGRPRSIALRPSTGSSAIDHALIAYIRRLHFAPGTR